MGVCTYYRGNYGTGGYAERGREFALNSGDCISSRTGERRNNYNLFKHSLRADDGDNTIFFGPAGMTEEARLNAALGWAEAQIDQFEGISMAGCKRGDGKLDKREFDGTFIGANSDQTALANARFDFFDLNNDDCVDVTEIASWLLKYDVDKDGSIESFTKSVAPDSWEYSTSTSFNTLRGQIQSTLDNYRTPTDNISLGEYYGKLNKAFSTSTVNTENSDQSLLDELKKQFDEDDFDTDTIDTYLDVLTTNYSNYSRLQTKLKTLKSAINNGDNADIAEAMNEVFKEAYKQKLYPDELTFEAKKEKSTTSGSSSDKLKKMLPLLMMMMMQGGGGSSMMPIMMMLLLK